MARYIDADKLIEQFDDTCKYAKPTNDYQRGCNEVFDWFVKIIKNIPTADVVPKSKYDLAVAEVERLRAKIKILTVPEDFAELKKEIHGGHRR